MRSPRALTVLSWALVFTLQFTPVLAERPSDGASQLRASNWPGATIQFSHLTTDDGLVQNAVEIIMQDAQGFIWIGTEGGLSRYDGYHFTNYQHDVANEFSLAHNHVRDLLVDQTGKLWIATEGGGLNWFDAQTGQFHRYPPTDLTAREAFINGMDRLFTISQDSQGRLWFAGTPQGGIGMYNPADDTHQQYSPNPNDPNGLPRISIWEITEDAAGQMWFVGENVLGRLNPETKEIVTQRVPAPERRLATLLWDAAGQLWAGGSDGLYHFDPTTGALVASYPALTQVNDLRADANGLIWVATLNGLHQFDPRIGQVVQTFKPDIYNLNSLNNERVDVLLEDAGGVWWVGTDGGVNLYNPRQTRFGNYRHNPSQITNTLAFGTINTLHVVDETHAWVGIGQTLDWLDLTTGTVVHHTLPQPGDVQSVYQDAAGTLWVGLNQNRLFRRAPGAETFELVDLSQAAGSIPTQRVGPPSSLVQIMQDHTGAIWVVSSHDGVFRLNDQCPKWCFYLGPTVGSTAPPPPGAVGVGNIGPNSQPPPPSAGALRIPLLNLYEDAQGRFWAGSQSNVKRFFPETGEFQEPTEGFDPTNAVEAIQVDASGILWAASRYGLLRYAPTTEALKIYTTRDGLPTNYLVGLRFTPAGELWISSQKGLARFNPTTETFTNYDKTDGLQGNEFIPLAMDQAPSGRLFVGGTNGLTVFDPASLTPDTYQPPVVFTGFELFNKPVTPTLGTFLPAPIWQTEQLTLNYDQNILLFEFAALSYAAPQKNRYRFMLENFKNDWVETDSTRRFASFTNLPAGDYVLRVQGITGERGWSDYTPEALAATEARLVLTVTPPWWETWWFRALAVVLLVGAVVGGVRWRLHATEQRNRELEKQVAERTQSLQERTLDLQASEEQLRYAKDAAESANRAKSAFLANMSHELRSPLNAILGFAQVLRRNRALPQDAQESLGIILRSGEHLLNLINQVLDLSKIEAGRLTLNDSDFDLHRLLGDLRDMFALKADDKRLQLIVDYPSDLPHYLRTDEIKLRQVLINLVNNALKFTTEGGVTVRASAHSEGHKTQVDFEVEDTGPGIAPHEMSLLFQAFAQTETGRHAQEGTGLGLPISRKFVQLMGGDITVKSELGRGTIFKFHIQAIEVSAIATRKTAPTQRVAGLEPGQPTYRILVADDNWANRRLLVQLLTPLGFEVREVENGQQAVAVAQEFAPQLIWMDMRMPVMDGIEATRRIKATPQGAAITIIALTASSMEEERATVLAAGCDEFMRKPFRDSELLATMQRHLGVRYVYQAEAPEAEAAPAAKPSESVLQKELAVLSVTLRQRLIEATELGDLELIDSTIAEIRQQQPVLAEALAQLAHQFEYDQLLRLLQAPPK